MPDNERDQLIIRRIRQYCVEIQETHAMFSHSRSAFAQSHVYRNVVSMGLMQIGELSGRLSDDFRNTHSDIPWKQIRGMRNLFAHQYLGLDEDMLWNTGLEDVRALQAFCDALLSGDSST